MHRREFLIGCGTACVFSKSSMAQSVTIAGRTFSSPTNFIEQGLRCGTPEPAAVTRTQSTRAFRAFRNLQVPFSEIITIPVHFHVIHSGDDGKVSESMITAQIDVLNSAYQSANLQFRKASTEYVDNSEWYEIGPPPVNPFATNKEADMKRALGKEQTSALNCYILKCQNSLLGWATFPWELSIDLARDGVVILNDSLPGGGASPFNLGHTATHEIGHWLSMFHTFQGGCDEPGDAVGDTPFEDSPANGCPPQRDSCVSAGSDPINNYMDYSDDSCMNQFTTEQISRMRAFIALFRQGLVPPPTVGRLNLRTRLRTILVD